VCCCGDSRIKGLAVKATGQTWKLDNDSKWKFFCDEVSMRRLAGKPPTVQFLKDKRTLDQNSMIYALYGQIAIQMDDQSTLDVRKFCKLHYGVAILKSVDPDFCEFYDRAIKKMSYEDKLFLMGHMDITSADAFKKPQATEYIEEILREYSKQGISLINPNEAESYA